MMHSSVEEKAVKCIRCGFCLDACPTFRLTGNEADSPRGRIYLMRSVAENVIPLDQDVMKHIDACLGCRACETACPSGVQYASILEEFRTEIEERGQRPGLQRFARRQLLNTLTNPRLFSATLKAAQVLGGSNGHQRYMPSFAAEMLTGSASAPVTLPAVPEKVSVGTLPEINPAIGEKRATVAMLAGCVMRVLYHDTNEATVRVLQQNGCEVLVPRSAGCCGALHVHNGYLEDARQRARTLLDALESVEMDAFIVNSAGCGSPLKEYGDLLAEDPLYAERARRFAAKVRDISEYLMELGLRPPKGSLNLRVAYHDACHLAHGQKITAPPRKMLQSIPGLELVDLPESDTCCGSAGIYNLTQPTMAKKLQQRKIDFILETGAAVIATGNPGCLAWIQQGLKERGSAITVRHPIEILDEAYRA
jgi:glycolate oxidase iron-sulfur subunit